MPEQERPQAGARFTNRVAVVTGGGAGVGAATARRFAAEGAAVVVVDINGDAADTTTSAIRSSGGRAESVVADVSREDDAARMIAMALDHFGRLDILHNNAAALGLDVYGRDGSLPDLELDVWDRTFAVNARGPLLGCKHAWPAMRAVGGGAIVNTVSVAAFHGGEDHAAYGSSKAAVVALTRYVAATYGPYRIRCNAVAPGLILSETARAVLGPEDMVEYEAERALPWAADPEDVADVVTWLASEESRCVTGHTIAVDSGILATRPRDAMKRWDALRGIGH